MIIDGNKLIPGEGNWLYNGEVCSDLVFLGKYAKAEDWQEISHYIEANDAERSYTEEQLNSITAGELKAICADMGISGSMTKANMISLILCKQSEIN